MSTPTKISSFKKREMYDFLRSKKLPRVTVKILLGYMVDGVDRMTIILGKGSHYDNMLLSDLKFRENELERYRTELERKSKYL